MSPNPNKTADLILFTQEIIDGKLRFFLCSECKAAQVIRTSDSQVDLYKIFEALKNNAKNNGSNLFTLLFWGEQGNRYVSGKRSIKIFFRVA